MTHRRWFMAAALAVAASGCLQKDTSSTVYLDPDGRCAWVVIERGVRSDSDTPAERDREERAYVEAIETDRHPTADALRAIGGRDVRTVWLRGTRPWSAAIEASFDTLDAPWDAALTACGVPHTTATSVRDGITTWRLELQTPEPDLPDQPECSAIAEGLVEALEGSIQLTRGRFVGAEGFDLESADRAVLSKDARSEKALERSGGRLVLSLSWTHRLDAAAQGR